MMTYKLTFDGQLYLVDYSQKAVGRLPFCLTRSPRTSNLCNMSCYPARFGCRPHARRQEACGIRKRAQGADEHGTGALIERALRCNGSDRRCTLPIELIEGLAGGRLVPCALGGGGLAG